MRPQKKRTKTTFSLQSFGHSLSNSLPVRTGHLADDGRRATVQPVPVSYELANPATSTLFSTSTDDDNDWLDVPDTQLPEAEATTRPKRKRKWYATTDANLRHWVANFCDDYLRVLVTREGLMGQDSVCSCGRPAKYRCSECYGVQLFCRECIVNGHTTRPLCRIERWNRTFFQKRELRHLGLRVQLCHPGNQPCPRARPGRSKFVVIAPNGFHHVALDFCECRLSSSKRKWEQLLLHGWYPATPDDPQSTITISALKPFHAVSLQGKTTAYHFFNALAKITDNTGSSAFKCRYQLALRVVRQWRNLRALKRGGMGNDPDRRTSETREGELTVDCLACPKAGVNLPEGWEKAPVEMRFLYTIFLAIDACFRLKRKKISSWLADPSLQDGWAYFVRSFTYEDFVKTLGEQKEMSTCTGLAALDHANTKYSQGYGNMDYVVASAWKHFALLKFFLLSYDIMCQWSKNLKERLLKLPPALRFHLAQFFVKFVIPKLHIFGHLRFCQEIFSLLLILGAAQSDMEGIERIWSSSGQMGASTREMGPGSRQDTLDDFWHYWNWNKVVGMGDTLRTWLLKATKELARQSEALRDFTQAQQDDAPAWKQAVDDFELGTSTVNPHEVPESGSTLRTVELELTREEQEREQASTLVRDAAEDTMTEYLILGLEIEGQQRQLAADLSANKSPTSKELTDFVTRRTRISRQIKKLRVLQRKYSPGALQRLSTTAEPIDQAEAERTPLFLPSALSPAESLPPLSVPGLALAEARLRDGQCNESLGNIRHGLIVKKRLQTYKTLNSRRQHQNTRSRGLVDGQQRKVDLGAATYRQARAARLALAHVAGASGWRLLEKSDLRLPEDEEEAKRRKQRAMKGKRKEAAQENENGEVRGVPGMGEKNRLVSWIWLSAGSSGGVVEQEIHACVRAEWCKAYARVKRWREEVLLLQEEMVRCLRTLEWQAGTWDRRAAAAHYSGKIAYEPVHLQGAMAFAAKQAAVRQKLAARFRQLWQHLTDRISGPDEAASSQSSGIDEDGIAGGGEETDDDYGHQSASEEEPVAGGSGDVPVARDKEEDEEDEEDEEEDGEGRADRDADADVRRAEMDKLLAMHALLEEL
ncbi:hypothetical protein DFH08DRAFT_977305 [Mycena albidolilacea]|uniref:CxC2-like cysteine cluster KDZ transposase-associated domain-containing protein n=1 Tax=Mycena albidolilacea TaxID=1033008 RepID=A0AAD7E8P3_9AGAR|nr:hypothetical protein DFH08DRAFT_977305 [Mycena albidolilacea]